MANFSNAELATILRDAVKDYRAAGVTDIPLSRPQLWAAIQAIRDLLDGAAFRNAVSGAIDTATSPVAMTAPQKKRLFGRVIQAMFRNEVA